MINKIKNKLILTNTFVLLIILLFMTGFIYFLSSYSFSESSDNELINMVYQAKRFTKSNFKNTNDLSYNEELKYFKQQINANKCKIVIFNSNLEQTYTYGEIKVNEDIFPDIAYCYFYDSNDKNIEIKEQDGKYVFTNYSYGNISFRSCTTLMIDDSGNMQLILMAKDNTEQNTNLNIILSALIIAIIVGVIISLLGGYYTADRALVPIKETIDNQKQFIADASHELRTPIAVIKTNLELIQTNEDETVKSQEMWFEYAKSEINRMDKMVGDLLTLTKADLGQIPFHNKENDIVHLIKDAIEKIEPIALKKQIRAYMYCSYDKVIANVDEDKFTQLLMILLDNAVNYSNENTKIIVALKVDKIKNNITIKVKDQGIGMKKEEIKKVFTRFYRVDKARSKRKNGSGLGLSIAKWIVTNLNGNINIESVENKGTDVIITLPLISYEENENGLT